MDDTTRRSQVDSGNIRSVGCSSEVREKTATYARHVADALGEDLVSICLYGSLARGCYHPATSDVDIVAVTTVSCPESAIAQILEAGQQAEVPLDVIFVTQSQMDLDETPTPIDFAIKPSYEKGKVVRVPQGLGDFLLMRQDVYECDLTLGGCPVREVVRPVPWEALADSLDYLLPNILPRFKNPALMLCRFVYAFANQRLCSKRTAGEWALVKLDTRWRSLVGASLTKYARGVADDQGPDEALRAFERHCLDRIASLRSATPWQSPE